MKQGLEKIVDAAQDAATIGVFAAYVAPVIGSACVGAYDTYTGTPFTPEQKEGLTYGALGSVATTLALSTAASIGKEKHSTFWGCAEVDGTACILSGALLLPLYMTLAYGVGAFVGGVAKIVS